MARRESSEESPFFGLDNGVHFKEGEMAQSKKSEVRELTQHVYHALILDEWPNSGGIVDFGLHSTEHYGALQYAVKCDGVTMEELDRALGSGPAIQSLISDRNPYRNVTFKTDW